MVGEALHVVLDGLKLTEDEKLEKALEISDNELEESDKNLQLDTICKLLTEKVIFTESFKMNMLKIWNLEDLVDIDKIGRNLFSIRFRTEKEKRRITEGGSWIFDKALLIFESPKGQSHSSTLEFRYVNLWVHFHNLPMVCYSRKYAVVLGNAIEEFLDVELNDNGNTLGETLKVRIKIDSLKPLKRGTKVKIGSMAEEKCVPVSYEKLPDHCYKCGRLGHVVKECEDKNSGDADFLPYEPDLRAKTFINSTQRNKQMRGRGTNSRGRRGNFNNQRWEQETRQQNETYNNLDKEKKEEKDRGMADGEVTGGELEKEKTSGKGAEKDKKEVVPKSLALKPSGEVDWPRV